MARLLYTKAPGGEGFDYIKYTLNYFTDILTMYSARACG